LSRIGSFIGHKGAVWGATLTGNAELAATAGSDFTAKLWDANTGAELQTFEHKHIVRSVDFSSINKEWLLTGSNEKLIKIYDVTAPTGFGFIDFLIKMLKLIFVRTSENL
jgi:serine-threonine kinase receptor-associated protein